MRDGRSCYQTKRTSDCHDELLSKISSTDAHHEHTDTLFGVDTLAGLNERVVHGPREGVTRFGSVEGEECNRTVRFELRLRGRHRLRPRRAWAAAGEGRRAADRSRGGVVRAVGVGVAQYFADGTIPEPLGSAHCMFVPYQAIRCADGYITFGSANDRLFQRLCDVLGHPEWVTDRDYANATLRVRNHRALADRIERITAQQPRRYWLERLDAAGIPCGPINNYAETFADPQVRARGMVVEMDHPTMGRMRTLGSPVKMSETLP